MGSDLLTDRYSPRGSGGEPVIRDAQPVRAHRGLVALGARLFAERGYQVIV